MEGRKRENLKETRRKEYEDNDRRIKGKGICVKNRRQEEN
jgi:hypothetical protein